MPSMRADDLRAIEVKLASLEHEVFSLRSELENAKRQAPPVHAVETVMHTGSPVESRANNVAATPIMAERAATPKVTAAPAAQRSEADSAFSWEWLIGGNIIGKVGIVTLILSTAFFMVYALDRGWLSEWVRLLLLQGAFAFAAYLSYRLYCKNYKYIPEILAITALAANTIAIYSAYFVYRFLERAETMAMMSCVMALALVFARRIRSTALTIILFVGFFILPVIHSRGINEPKTYFAYLFAVNLLYFFLQRYKTSPHTVWVIIFANTVSLLGWAGAYQQYSTAPLLFCAATLAMLLYSAHRADWGQSLPAFFRASAIIVTNLLYIAMVASVLALNKSFTSDVTALALLCLAAINYIVLQFLSRDMRNASAAAFVVVLCMAIGVAIVAEGHTERLLIALLLTSAMYVAGKWPDKLLFFGATAANGINLIVLFFTLSHAQESWFVLNFQAATLLFYAIAAMFMRVKKIWPNTPNFGMVLTGVALLASFVCVIAELQRIITAKDSRLLMVTLVFATYALVLLFIGFRWQKVWFRQAGLFFMGLAIAKFYFIDIWQWDKAIRIIAGIVMGGGLVLVSFYYEKFKNKFKELSAVLILIGLLAPSQPAEAAEKFTPHRFKFMKEIAAKADFAGQRYGSVVVDADIYRHAGENDVRLAYEGKIIPYARQMKKTSAENALEKNIPLSNLVTSVDGENTSVYLLENKEGNRISGLKLQFKEQDFTREIRIYHKAGRFQPNALAKTVTLKRKSGKPEIQRIDFAAVSGELQLQIVNDDDAALELTKFSAVSEPELLVFRVPDNFAGNKTIQLYYGAEYAQKPHYDIADTLEESTSYIEFSLGAEMQNNAHKLTLFDPPYSIWLFRTVFWLLLVLIAWRMYALYKKDKSPAPDSTL